MFKTSGLWILCYKLSGHAYDEESHCSDLSSILSCGTGVPFSGACIAPVCVSYEFTFLYLLGTLGSCSNGNGKGHKNVKRAISLIRKTTISRVTCSVLFGSFPCRPFTSMTSYATYPYLVPFISCCYVLTWTLKKCWNTLCELLLGWQFWECRECVFLSVHPPFV